MLKGIDPLLGPELLMALASMGHGDELAVVDRNFPAVSVARRLVRLDGVPLNRGGHRDFQRVPHRHLRRQAPRPYGGRGRTLAGYSRSARVPGYCPARSRDATYKWARSNALISIGAPRRVRDRGYRGATGLWQFRDLQGWALVRPDLGVSTGPRPEVLVAKLN